MADEEEPFFVSLSDEELTDFDGDLEYHLDLEVPPRLRTAFNGMLTQIATDARKGRLRKYYADGNMSVGIYGYGDYDFKVFNGEEDYGEIDRRYDNVDRRSGSRRNGEGYGSRDGERLARERNRRAGSFGQSVQNGTALQQSSDSGSYGRYTQSASEEVRDTVSRIDDDYMPLAERYDAGIATNDEIDKMRELVDEAAYAAGLPSAQYALVVYDEDGNVVPLAERAARVARFSLDDDLIEQYGAIEQGREPRARDVQVPRQSADNMRVSKFTRSIEKAVRSRTRRRLKLCKVHWTVRPIMSKYSLPSFPTNQKTAEHSAVSQMIPSQYPSSSSNVLVPAWPSTVRPSAFWKALTAATVSVPQ